MAAYAVHSLVYMTMIEDLAPPTRRTRFATQGARILLAEDDREMRAMIAAALCKDGYDVTIADDGGQLLLRLAHSFVSKRPEDRYDAVISDIRMPVCSGLNVLEGLRQAHWTMPVVLMTAFGDAATRARVESHDAVLFDKPFDIDDLRTAVLHLMHKREAVRNQHAKSLVGEHGMLALVGSYEDSLEAWSIHWLLQSEGIRTYLGGRTLDSSSRTTDLYVLTTEVARVRSLIGGRRDDAD